MTTRYYSALILVFFILAAAGCGPRIPPRVSGQVSWEGEFSTLQDAPEEFEGEFVILGGKIIKTVNSPDYSEITVVHLPTDSHGRPRRDRESGGRFLIRTDSFVDPEIYPPGKLISAAGRIAGSQKRDIGQYPYTYPVLEAEEMWIWEDRKERSPRFRFGVGIGKTF